MQVLLFLTDCMPCKPFTFARWCLCGISSLCQTGSSFTFAQWDVCMQCFHIGGAGAILVCVPSGRHIFVQMLQYQVLQGMPWGALPSLLSSARWWVCLHICQMQLVHASPSLLPDAACACKSFTFARWGVSVGGGPYSWL